MFSTSLRLSLGDNLVITQWLSLILPLIGIESVLSVKENALGDVSFDQLLQG